MRKQKGRNFNIISKTLEKGEKEELYLDSGTEFGFNDAVEASECVIAGDVSLFLLTDVVPFVFLANRVDPRDDAF